MCQNFGLGESDAGPVGFSGLTVDARDAAQLFFRRPIVDPQQILPFANRPAQNDQPSARASVPCVRFFVERRSARATAVDSERHIPFPSPASPLPRHFHGAETFPIGRTVCRAHGRDEFQGFINSAHTSYPLRARMISPITKGSEANPTMPMVGSSPCGVVPGFKCFAVRSTKISSLALGGPRYGYIAGRGHLCS
jgi:hypothetical protein